MARSTKQVPSEVNVPAPPTLAELTGMTQIDFELDFFGRILDRHPRYFEALRCHASNLVAKKRYQESSQVERQIIQLRPQDPLAYYNLACSYALLTQPDLALSTLRKALEFGYRDFHYIHKDHDLDALRGDPRFKKLLREFEKRS